MIKIRNGEDYKSVTCSIGCDVCSRRCTCICLSSTWLGATHSLYLSGHAWLVGLQEWLHDVACQVLDAWIGRSHGALACLQTCSINASHSGESRSSLSNSRLGHATVGRGHLHVASGHLLNDVAFALDSLAFALVWLLASLILGHLFHDVVRDGAGPSSTFWLHTSSVTESVWVRL